MSEQIFREKSLERIQSPEDMNEYIRVCSPGVWLLLAGVLILLAGFCIWGFAGHALLTVDAVAYVDNGETTLAVEHTDQSADSLVGLPVRIGDTEGVVSALITADDEGSICGAVLSETLPDGVYAAQIVTESVRPISFVLN